MGKTFDFSGWATRANLLCADGRVIMPNAFEDCDGKKVPMVWMHQHDVPERVLGHAVLENRDDGVYAYCTFNNTDSGQNAKLLVQNGDVTQMSIYANKLKHQGRNVVHGMIREVSLVLAGANPGAVIETIMMHGEDCYEEGWIRTGDALENVDPLIHEDPIETSESLSHAEHEEKGAEEEMAEEIKKPEAENNEGKTIQDVLDTFTEEQKTVLYALVGMAQESAEKAEVQHSSEESDEDLQHSMEFEGGNHDMIQKRNLFDQPEEQTKGNELSHSEMTAIMDEAKRGGSLKDTILAHGIEELEIMFPEHKALNNQPEFIKREDGWVARVLGGVHHTPFSRIKTIFADITAAEARAKGYQKGNLKIEEVFKLLKRVTNPTTIYKKQKFDRDDVIDINWDMLPFVKKEMRMMFDEELARAILIGDGRDPVEEANDKINEDCIRPIWKMEDLFTVKVEVPVAADASADARARAFIKACIKSRKQYKGSGNPVMFMSEDLLTDCLLIEDTNQRTIYDTPAQLAAKLRVKEIITVPVMEGVTRTNDADKVFELGAIYVNLNDYNVGTDKGGELNFFDDFDIDYNKMTYLLEGRCSGSLTKPFSAVAIEFTEA